MQFQFHATVSALVYSLIEERCRDAAVKDPAENNRVVRFILDQHRRMPDYLRLPLKLLTVAFDLWSVPRHLQRFHGLPHDLRWRQVQSWKRSRFGVRRDLIRFYESLAVFGWYAQTHEGTDVRRNAPAS
jgi:hypothetical protein